VSGWVNPPNYLGDFLKRIKIRVLFCRGQCEPCAVCGEGLEEVGED
jgi:hypothetical protein